MRRSLREVRVDARVAAPQAGQNAMSGTTISHWMHSSGWSWRIGSCASCSSASCNATRSATTASTAALRWMASIAIWGSPTMSTTPTEVCTSKTATVSSVSNSRTRRSCGPPGANHSTMPAIPPAAAAVTGIVTPVITTSTISPCTGRAWANNPAVNCGANRASVAAVVNTRAPSAPMTKPSNDSRVPGRVNRRTNAGSSISVIPVAGMPTPSPTRWCSARPALSETS